MISHLNSDCVHGSDVATGCLSHYPIVGANVLISYGHVQAGDLRIEKWIIQNGRFECSIPLASGFIHRLVFVPKLTVLPFG